MPLHDYRCPACARIARDVYRAVTVGAAGDPPTCILCDRLMVWIPQVGAIDAKEPFQQFQVYDGRNRPVTIDSLRQLRRVEAESERMARNGEGQPMVWRHYSQDASNADVHTLARDPSARPDPAFLRKLSRATGDAVTTRAFATGVSEANCSALPDP